jgi:hypothetical protein
MLRSNARRVASGGSGRTSPGSGDRDVANSHGTGLCFRGDPRFPTARQAAYVHRLTEATGAKVEDTHEHTPMVRDVMERRVQGVALDQAAWTCAARSFAAHALHSQSSEALERTISATCEEETP